MDAKTLKILAKYPELDAPFGRGIELAAQMLDRLEFGELDLSIKIQAGRVPSFTVSPKEIHKCNDRHK